MLVLDINLKNKATGQYQTFGLSGMVKFNRKFFAVSSSGIYSADSVDLTNTGYFKTGKLDFGVNNDKRLRYVYLSLESTTNLTLTVNTEKVAAQNYTISISGTGQQDIRVPISRSLYGRFWTFKLSGAGDFSVDEMTVLPIIRGLHV